MSVWFFDSYYAKPCDAIELDPSDERVWEELLGDPHLVALDDHGHKGTKNEAPALCGARYFAGSTTRVKENVEVVEALVLDVDCDETEIGRVPSAEEMDEALSKYRAVIYTTASHTKQKPRWRVILPLATPLAPKMCRSLVQHLSDNLVPDYPGCIDVDATGDPCRLGFVKVTKHPEHYGWWMTEGEVFDWRGIDLTEEEWASGKLSSGDMERQPGWTDRATALQQAIRHYATRGYDGVRDGEHRRIILWKAANALWWTWAAEDEDFVLEVLESINAQFSEAKPQEDLIKKMHEAHAITVGTRRKVQTIGAYGWKREPSHSATEETIKALARKLKSRTNLSQVRVGDELLRVAKGETIADDPAVWKSACTRVAHVLAEQFSHDTKEKLAGFFDRSLKAMAATGNPIPSTENIQNWIGLRIAQVRERWAEDQEKREEKIKQEIEYVTGGARNTKYTKEEVDAWMGPHGPGLSPRSWLIQVGKVTYVFMNGGYSGPYGESEFDAQGYIDLAPAIDFVQSKKYNEKEGTWTNVRLKELLQRYGSQATTEIDYSCERTWFRKEDRTLCLAGPPRADLQPTFHTEIDEWLRRMGGRPTPADDRQRFMEASTSGTHDDYDAICNWLACITVLNRTCAALYLQGPTGVGKDMFGNGLAKIWKNGKITIEKALGKFNKGLTDTPLIHVNEGLPKGMSASVLLRRTLADVEHPYERKHVDAGKIKGCVRMLFTANNLNIFDEANDEKLQHEDTEALRDRFVHVRVRREAAAYLRSLGPSRADFVNKNMLAEHALWLHEKRWDAIRTRDLRFLVEGKNHSVSNVVATNVGHTSEVCSVLAEAFSDAFITGRVQEFDWFAVRDGQLFVNSTGARRQVLMRNPSVRASEREVALAVSSISEGAQRKKMLKIQGRRVKMWPVKIEALEAWCENARAFDWEDVLQGMIKFDKPLSQEEKDEV